jgi:DNA (cytosine-5)-methyltransferase 1
MHSAQTYNTLVHHAVLSSMTKIFNYKWKLTELADVPKNGLKVFSTFACGGGSTMGYKMSGFEVIGCNEIDPEMIEIYRKNHSPKYSYLEPIQTFKERKDLPPELYNLDILDGSPPCSSFSMSGSREDAWGKEKKFREGQANQVLDDLFFHFIDLAFKLRPKVVIAENVKGMLQGNAKGYVKKVSQLLKVAGYDVQIFLLNGASMGLPQKRERVFFVARRNDLNLPPLRLSFHEKPISVKEAFSSIADINYKGRDRSDSKPVQNHWSITQPGKSFASTHPKGSLFNWMKLPIHEPAMTIPGHAEMIFHYESPRNLSKYEYCVLSSFPLDYKFKSDELAGYQVGMSVPPMMMHKLSQQIYQQWFKNAV